MSKYRTREELFAAYQDTPTDDWYRWVYDISIPYERVKQTLYHISFDSRLPSRITPRENHHINVNKKAHEIYHEPIPDCFSTSPTLEGCWAGIYANYSRLFENKVSQHPEIKLQVYKVTPARTAKVLTPIVAQKEWLLYDAHITHEHCVFGECELEHLGELILQNTTDAPDSQWVTFYPFNQHQYKKLYAMPPFKVIHQDMGLENLIHQHQPEYPMYNDIVSLPTEVANRTHLSQINMESFGTPFRAMNDSIKRNLHSVISNSPQFKPSNAKENELSKNYHQVVNNAKNTNVKVINFSDMRNTPVVVPVGFKGDYLSYFQLLIKQFVLTQNIVKDVIVPAHNLVLKYIGKPDTMSNIDPKDLNRIKFHHKEIEDFKKQMNKFFDAKKKHQVQPVNKLIRNINELGTLTNDIRKGVVPWMFNDKWNGEIFRAYTDFQKSMDLLMVRIEQKPEVYQLNKLNAERLAQLVNDVAVEIELAGATYVYLNQMLACVVQLQDTAIRFLKDK